MICACDPRLTGDTFMDMIEVTIRDLRNQGGKVLERVERGEVLTVTRDGRPVAELRPLPRRPVPAATLLSRWHGLPAVDPATLRADLDDLLDASL
jgi:prevent-host-death family protein